MMKRVQRKNTRTADEWAKSITTAWQKSVESIIETGRQLKQAQDELEYGQWLNMIEEKKVPFEARTAQRLMRIAEHPILSNATNLSLLPPSWSTLYRLTELPDDVLEGMIADGTLNCEITGKEVDEIHEQVYRLGHYKWANLRDALEQLIRFAKRWPNVSEMVEVMHRDLEEAPGMDEEEDPELVLVDYPELTKVSEWIAAFAAQCTARQQELERQQEEEWSNTKQNDEGKKRNNRRVSRRDRNAVKNLSLVISSSI